MKWQNIREDLVFFIVIICVTIFSMFIIFETIDSISRDYRYAVIGATGSLIGGGLTLIGVWWTIRQNNKDKFVNDFPKKIKAYNEIIIKIQTILDSKKFLVIHPEYEKEYMRLFDDMILKTVDINGVAYFKVYELKDIYFGYKVNLKNSYSLMHKEIEETDKLSQPEGYVNKQEELQELFISSIEKVLSDMKQQAHFETEKFFSYQKNV